MALTISDIVATTLARRSGKLADNVTENNALLYAMKKSGRIRTASGGSSIYEELSFPGNDTGKWYSGYENLDIRATDVITAANYPWKQAAVVVTMSGLEMLQNSGPDEVISLMKGRIMNAEATLANMIDEGLYSAGTGSAGKQLSGLQLYMSTTANSGTVGGINKATYTWWRQSVTSGTALTAGNIKTMYNQKYQELTRNMDGIDVMVADDDHYNLYWGTLVDQQRFMSGHGKLAKGGFDALQFNKAELVMGSGIGSHAPDKKTYFINSKYLHWRPHSRRNMVPLKKREVYNQDAIVQIIAFAGNLTCSGLRFQGVISDT